MDCYDSVNIDKVVLRIFGFSVATGNRVDQPILVEWVEAIGTIFFILLSDTPNKSGQVRQ